MTGRGAVLVIAILVVAASVSQADTYAVVVAGLGGEAEYEDRFSAQARDLAEASRALARDPARVQALSGKAATREAIRTALAAVAASAGADDVVLVAWIGHGNLDGASYKFNVPGPDPTCEELRDWMSRVPARRQLVILATSASGACVGPLARDGRVVLSATRSGSERNAPVFGRYFIEALREPAADRDHDQTLTALEAFRYAEQKVRRFYADAQRLATEHPVVSSERARDFILAQRGPAARQSARLSPALAARKAGLEAEIAALKERKTTLSRDSYLDDLERLLLDLARVQETIEADIVEESSDGS